VTVISMPLEYSSDLPKLGHRPYIQGGSIFNDTLDVCDRALGLGWLHDAVITSFKLERESRGNGKFVVSEVALDGIEPNATLAATHPKGRVFVYYVDEGRPTRQESYDEESYYRIVRLSEGLDGEFILSRDRPRTHFMRGIVGANKRLHEKTTRFSTPLSRIQFLYLRELQGVCILRSAEEYRVSINNVTVRERGSEAWTINRVAVRGESFESEFHICYRAATQAATPPR
jgi:hypothetical protein